MAETLLRVPDISCEHCAHTIHETLTPLDGVEHVDVDIDKKEVRLRYEEGKANLQAIRAALAEEGYPVSVE